MSQKTLVIATRGSKLALWQADYVAEHLRQAGYAVEKNVIKTTGDRVQDRFLHEIGGKGLFIGELEQAMRRGEADLAVHSLKDMPAKVPEGFTLTAILKRHSPADAFIFPELPVGDPGPDGSGLKDLAPHVGTSSLRRSALLARFCPKAKVSPLRGNVDTRIGKMQKGDYDGILLAEASLERLGWKESCHYWRLDPTWFIPCAGQGALAIETPGDSPYRAELVRLFDHRETRVAVEIERSILAALGGDCTMPFGAYVANPFDGGVLQVGVYSAKGAWAEARIHDLRLTPEGGPEEQADLRRRALQELVASGLHQVMDELSLALPANFESLL